MVKYKRRPQTILSKMRVLAEELEHSLTYSAASEIPIISCPADAYSILRPVMAWLDHEELWIIALDTRNRVKSIRKVYMGSLNQSLVRVGELFAEAVQIKASAIIVAHNHPSGDPSPSPEDVALTRLVVEAGKLLDITLSDHLVVCADRFVSLRERGLGF